MKPLSVTSFTSVSAIGHGREDCLSALVSERGGLTRHAVPGTAVETYVGRVEGLDDWSLDGEFAAFDCRNNRLAEVVMRTDGFAAAVAAAIDRYGSERVGVVLGTSTSGIAETELAFCELGDDGRLPAGFDYRHTHELYSLAEFVRRRLGARGVAYTISTACSSSAKCFADAVQLLTMDICDAVVVGGVDTLCLTTLLGFNSLQLLSRQPCRPNDAARDGISIGEAGGLVLLERADAGNGGLQLLGYGESSDAHHMSAPHPEGEGARLAMRAALSRAGLEASQIDYLNLHGTGTPSNDTVEDRAVVAEFGTSLPCSSTKGWTGHTLGAAGIVEAVICLIALAEGVLPGNLNTETVDPQLSGNIVLHSQRRSLRRVLSNNFGFGGNNCSLIFGAV